MVSQKEKKYQKGGDKKLIGKYILGVYKNEIFLGYVSNYKIVNYRYRFNKTKNLYKSQLFLNISFCESVKCKLSTNLDHIYHLTPVTFKIIEIDDQELRKSKINNLSYCKIKTGIFKRASN